MAQLGIEKKKFTGDKIRHIVLDQGILRSNPIPATTLATPTTTTTHPNTTIIACIPWNIPRKIAAGRKMIHQNDQAGRESRNFPRLSAMPSQI